MIRDFKARDDTAVVALLTDQFPEEEALIGSQPERFLSVIHRVMKWHIQLLIGLYRLSGRRLYRFLVADDGGRVVGTTLLTFPAPSVYLSMVVVDPAVRRRGHARAMLDEARATARRMRRRYLVLDVLANNAPARALYEGTLGYRPLRENTFMTRDRPADLGPERTALPPGIRSHRRSDDPAVVAIARRRTPATVTEVLPVARHPMSGARTGNAILNSETAAWVVDRGSGAEAFLYATSTPDEEAGHLSDPIVSENADPALVRELVRVALAWMGARGRIRALSSVPRYNLTGRAALEAEGFHDALSTWTLYLPVG